MNIMEETMIAKVRWKSADGFQFIGEAQGHDWDIVSTTPKAVGQLDVGVYVWCRRKTNEDWGIYLEEVTNAPFASETEWRNQERAFQ